MNRCSDKVNAYSLKIPFKINLKDIISILCNFDQFLGLGKRSLHPLNLQFFRSRNPHSPFSVF